eukprot:8448862-Lingulodinium_polyedra.AAC.1
MSVAAGEAAGVASRWKSASEPCRAGRWRRRSSWRRAMRAAAASTRSTSRARSSTPPSRGSRGWR